MKIVVNQQIEETLQRLIEMLDQQDLDFALIGGLAASIRGRVRVTEDIDVIVDCDVARAVEMLDSLDPKVFRPFLPDPELVLRQCFLLPISDSQTQVRIDLAVGESGFEKIVVQRASPVPEHSIPVATAEDLLLMKLMAGRHQDIQDVDGIVAISRDSIDWRYCHSMASQLQAALDIDLVALVAKLESGNADRE